MYLKVFRVPNMHLLIVEGKSELFYMPSRKLMNWSYKENILRIRDYAKMK